MLRLIVSFILSLSVLNVAAQIDSLINVITLQGPDSTTMANLNTQMANLYYQNTKASVNYSSKILSLVENDPNEYYKGIAMYFKGNAEYANENHGDAIGYHLESAKIFEKQNNKSWLSKAYNGLGVCYQIRKEVSSAAQYFKDAISLNEEIQDTFWVANISSNLGGHYMEYDSLEAADKYLQKSIAFYSKPEHRLYQGFAKLNYGSLLVKKRAYLKAISFLKESKDQVPLEVSPLVHAVANSAIGNAYLELQKYSDALGYLQNGYQQAKSIDHNEQLEAASDLLSRYHYESGNYKSAYLFQKESFALKDSFLNAESDGRLIDALKKYETDKKESEIKLLAAQNQLQNLTIKQGNRNLIIAAIGFFGLAAFAYNFWKNQNRFKTLNQNLVYKNEVIASSLKEKETLLKEIHHRVKNNLQVISSLLSLQSDYVKDDAAIMAFKEGRDRVKSMAMIHQNLYQEHDLTGIDMQSYFEKLTSSLFNSYNIKPDTIDLEMEIENISLDVDTVIPIGLVVNELITNALKYAFPNDVKGVIKVTLKEQSQNLELSVVDNGIGMNTSIISEESEGFGYNLIHTFKEKLDADLQISNSEGTSVILKIKDYQKTA